jgi:hypothetical protein
VGTLVVDIFDKTGKSLLWRGVAQDELSDKPEKNVKKLGKASDKLFKDFPPGQQEVVPDLLRRARPGAGGESARGGPVAAAAARAITLEAGR